MATVLPSALAGGAHRVLVTGAEAQGEQECGGQGDKGGGSCAHAVTVAGGAQWRPWGEVPLGRLPGVTQEETGLVEARSTRCGTSTCWVGR